MSTTSAPFSRADWKRVRRARQAVKRMFPWWVALGHEEGNGLRMGSRHSPWSSLDERDLWRQWSCGDGDEQLCALTLDRFRQLGIDPSWLVNIAQLFYSEVWMANPPAYWDDPNWSPTLAHLRWVQEWPWDPQKQAWVVGNRRMPPIPAFRPWADIPQVGVPQPVGAWMDRVLSHSDSQFADAAVDGLTGPLSIAVLLQTQWLQALGGGHWDWATLYR